MKCEKKSGVRVLSGKAFFPPSHTDYQVCRLGLVTYSLRGSFTSSVEWECNICLVPRTTETVPVTVLCTDAGSVEGAQGI